MVKRFFFFSVVLVFSLFVSKNTFSQTVQTVTNPDNGLVTAMAQPLAAEKIAYVNSKVILELIPEKVQAQKAIEDLNKKYKEELSVMQNDYNRKYSDFMTYQSSMTDNIKLRRMQELYELEKSIANFMKVAQEDIDSQEQQQIAPLRAKVKEAIEQVGLENNFICIYDLANPAISFVTPKAVDATPLVKKKLGITYY